MISTTVKKRKTPYKSKGVGRDLLTLVFLAFGGLGILIGGVVVVALAVGVALLLVGAFAAPFAWLLQFAWNGFAHAVFDAPELTFWQAYSAWFLVLLVIYVTRRLFYRQVPTEK